MLRAVLASGHLEDVGYAQQGLQCVPVSHHLYTNTNWCHIVKLRLSCFYLQCKFTHSLDNTDF